MERPAPPNTYKPGTVLTVGSHRAVVINYMSEGGFAHVYKVEITPPWAGTTVACLKRVAVPDKPSLNTLRAEVDSMKRLAGHRHIVSYIDSHAARLNNGQGYEVFVLMELCGKKGLIDFMNTRLQTRLTEPEVLRIMAEITEGVANMHALNPPLVHRDIKIENVLISDNGDFKLCDFGSASPVLRPPRNSDEFAILQNDVLKNTTPQYRSPEMVDLYRGLPIDEKSDIWALGIFLYKLCYYTTPFESKGELAILHAKFEYPDRPVYSDRLKNLIAVLLREDPRRRPNAYQTLEEVCRMRGLPVSIEDYTKARKSSAPVSSLSTQQQQNTPLQLPTPPSNGYTLPQKPTKSTGSQMTPVISTAPKYQPYQPKLPGSSLPSHHSASDLVSSYTPRPVSAISSNYVPESKDPFKDLNPARLQSPPPKPPRPTTSNALSSLNKSMGNLTLGTKLKPAVPYKPKYVDSVVQTEDPSAAPAPTSRSSSRPPSSTRARPQSMYVQPSQGRSASNFSENGDMDELKRIITGLSGKSSQVELSPGENHINSNVDFLKNLQQQDSGKSWVQQHTGGSISSLRRISTGSKNLISQFTGKFSRSHSRSSSRASSIHENHGIYGSQSSSTMKLRVSSDSIDEETTLQAIEEPKKLQRSSSIQRRVQALLSKNNDPPIVKTAQGYGNDDSSDVTAAAAAPVRSKSPIVDSDGFKKPTMLKRKPPVPKRKPAKTPPLTAQSTPNTLTKKPQTKSSGTKSDSLETPPLTAQSTPSTVTKKPHGNPSSDKSNSPTESKKAPPKPKKPTHLKSSGVKSPSVKSSSDGQYLTVGSELSRTLSTSSSVSNISIPDIDEIEKSFNRRYPRAV